VHVRSRLLKRRRGLTATKNLIWVAPLCYNMLTETQRRNRRIALVLTAVVALLLVGGGVYLTNYAETETEYEYEVKAEQVYDNGKISESVELGELSADEKELLHSAFKNSDEFLGGSGVHVSVDEKLGSFDGWRVVEYQGVYMLVAIEGPDSTEGYVGWLPILVEISMAALTLLGIMFVLEAINPSNF